MKRRDKITKGFLRDENRAILGSISLVEEVNMLLFLVLRRCSQL